MAMIQSKLSALQQEATLSLVITKDIPKALKCKIEGSHTGWEGLRGLGVTNVGKIPSFFLETVPISVDL